MAWIHFAILAALAALCLSCAPARGVPTIVLPTEPPAEEAHVAAAPLRVGAYLSLTGAGSSRGTRIKEGISLAVDELNDSGGVGGRPLEVVYADDGSDPSMIVNRVAELIFLQKAIGLLGDVTLQSSAAGSLAEKNQVPLIAPVSPMAEARPEGSFVFHACAGPDEQGRLSAAFVAETMGKKRVGVLYCPGSAYSTALASAFRDEARRLGVEALIERPFGEDEARSAIPLLEIMDERPDVIYAPVEPAFMAKVARTAMIAGISGEMFLGCDAWGAEDFLREAGDALSGAFFLDHWAMDAPWAASVSFVNRYKERFQRDPTTLSALSYDSAKMLADALLRSSAGGLSGGASAGRTPTREAVREALENRVEFAGVTGVLRASASHDVETGMVVRRIEGGKAVYSTALTPAARE